MEVVVLSNQPTLPSDHPEVCSETWVETTAEDVSAILTAGGLRVSRLDIGRDLADLKRRLVCDRPTAVFNLYEGLADRPASEIAVARLLERLQIPFTGSSSRALHWSLSKPLGKRRLHAAGVPTPWSCVVKKRPFDPRGFSWPVIVKPARRDASEGIDQGSIVTEPAALLSRVCELLDRMGPPVLIEEFLPGREFTVALVETPELVALPVAEVHYVRSQAAPWPILTYAAKWATETPEYDGSSMVQAAPLPAALAARLVDLASRSFRALHCRDYARVDLRLNAAGEPMVLEVNANPDLSPTACFAGALASGRIDRAEFLIGLVHRALRRSSAERSDAA
jgi:D-alanine-D-alanine ligase